MCSCFPMPVHTYSVQVQCYPPLWQLHSVFGDLSNGVCHIMTVTGTESNPDMIAFCSFSRHNMTNSIAEIPEDRMQLPEWWVTQQTFHFSATILTPGSKLPVMTRSIASHFLVKEMP